jgi:Protein of unknown function, DUF485
MGTRLVGGITVGYVLMAGLFVLVWALVFAYGRFANRRWDAQAARVVELAQPPAGRAAGQRTGPPAERSPATSSARRPCSARSV